MRKINHKTLPKPLSAQDKSSFAYKTVKDRLPVILVKVIDFAHRLHSKPGLEQYCEFIENGEKNLVEATNELNNVIGELARLRKLLETNKPLETFIIRQPGDDTIEGDSYVDHDLDVWNEFIMRNCQSDGTLPQWFVSPWLLVECYMYRKVKDAFSQTKYLKRFDPFCEQKRQACKSQWKQMQQIATYLLDIHDKPPSDKQNQRKLFLIFSQLSLWANRCDLSLSGMDSTTVSTSKVGDESLEKYLQKLKDKILCDNLNEAWECIEQVRKKLEDNTSNLTQSQQVQPSVGVRNCGQFGITEIFIDFISDNSGFELFVDLCLMHCLNWIFNSSSSSTPQEQEQKQSIGKKKLIQRLHVKRLPWFVSDTQAHDLKWLLNEMQQDTQMAPLAQMWRTNLSSQSWRVHDHMFWTLPHDYAHMPETSPDLYAQLRGSSFLIFKGDLNYRKLTGDLQWNILTPFKDSLRGFMPGPLMALRTCKANVVVGIDNMEIYQRINNNELPRDWMVSGEFGLIQVARP